MLAARDAAARGARDLAASLAPPRGPATLSATTSRRAAPASSARHRPAPLAAAARGDGRGAPVSSISGGSSSSSSSDDAITDFRRRQGRGGPAAGVAVSAAAATAPAFAAPAVGAPPPLAPAAPAPPPLPVRAAALADRLAALSDPRARLAFLLKAARDTDKDESSSDDAGQQQRRRRRRAEELRAAPDARVIGCTTATFCAARLAVDGASVEYDIDSDSELTRGVGALLADAMRGLSADAAAAFDAGAFLRRAQLGAADAAAAAGTEAAAASVAATSAAAASAAAAAAAAAPPAAGYTRDRADGAANLAAAMRRRAAALSPRGRALRDAFPSLVISADALTPRGAFAEAQARYLEPDLQGVERLARVLRDGRVGVVAHFYMDPEVQGALASVAAVPAAAGGEPLWPHVHISDSLVMADAAVRMARAGCRAVAVLGVDFMSENVRAILDEAGFRDVAVYRLSADRIGCSLAEAAEGEAYEDFLAEAAARADRDREPALHVVYINTSLRTKARAHARVPTITCTSSNVVQTVLQAFAQEPRARVYYGPDTYMGRNLEALLTALAEGADADVRALHADHTAASVRALLPRLHHFGQGSCVVHHVFGGQVAEAVRLGYSGDAYLTAHFEVPGEMFALAMEARARGSGVVGSTSNILDFIGEKVGAALREAQEGQVEQQGAAAATGAAAGGKESSGNGSGGGGAHHHAPRGEKQRVRFVLGTEAGMITSIVRRVQGMLRAAPQAARDAVEVEVVFPVATGDAVTTRATLGGGGGGFGRGGGNGGDPSFSSQQQQQQLLPEGLAVVPGPAGGEGCSLEGGCAACPYMRMNTLDALMRVAGMAGAADAGDTAARAFLAPHRPAAYPETMALPPGAGGPGGAGAGGERVSAARAGCVPILHMRAFGQQRRLPQDLVDDMRARFGAAAV